MSLTLNQSRLFDRLVKDNIVIDDDVLSEDYPFKCVIDYTNNYDDDYNLICHLAGMVFEKNGKLYRMDTSSIELKYNTFGDMCISGVVNIF